MAHLVKLLNAGDKKLATIRILRDFVFDGLKECKDATDNTPTNLKTFESYSDAEELAARLKAVGAEVEIISWSDEKEDEKEINNTDSSFIHYPQETMFSEILSKRLKNSEENKCFVFMKDENIYAATCIGITQKCKELLSSTEFIQEDSVYDTLEQLFKSKMQHLTTMYTLRNSASNNGKTEYTYFSVVIMEIPEIHNTIENIRTLCSICEIAHKTILEYTTSLNKLEHLEKDLNGTITESD